MKTLSHRLLDRMGRSSSRQATPQPRRGAGLRWWYDRLLVESKKERQAVRHCLMLGLAMQGVVMVALMGLAAFVARYNPRMTLRDSLQIAAAIGGGIGVLMLIIASLTKPEGRAETASRLAVEGFRSGGRQGDPMTAALVAVLMLIALYGSYAIVEAFVRTRARWRLRKVDLIEAARVLAEVAERPRGSAPRDLLKWGQRLDTLRGPVALLMLDGWIDVVDGGRTVVQRSDTMRSLHRRHPLAEVFQSVGA